MSEEHALIALNRKDSIETYKEDESLLEGTAGKNDKRFSWKVPFRLESSLRRVRRRLRKMSCITRADDAELTPTDVPRHKSIDIGVGLARRVSLFIFTRRSVCLHPYHPYTPKQTTRKISLRCDEKQKN
ncbi:unnamed protein product [Leptosia nina]|uniref:Uncharacterized protein n=1 Tax=Leptosia nina TaxID=320188 RepID=A0AAV1J776_9NEOP